MKNKKKLPHKTDLPLTLWLEGTADALFIQEAIRTVPGKRWVVSTCWGEQQIIAKVFAKRSQAQRELRGIAALDNAKSILMPKLLYHGWSAHYHCYILVFEKIDPAEDVDAIWWCGSTDQRIQLLNKLVKLTAHLHAAGLQQTDTHLKNFLLHHDNLYLVDAGGIVQTTRGFMAEKTALKNLAVLFSQVSPDYDRNCEAWYRLYIQERGLVFTLTNLIKFKAWIRYWRRKHFKVYSKKVLRNTSHVLRIQRWDRVVVCDRAYWTPALQQFCVDPESILQKSQVQFLKQGNTCTVMQMELDGRPIVIKRYNIKNFWHGLNRALRPSRASIYWRNAMCLASWRLPIAKPIAFIEKRIGPFRRQAYYLMEYVAGTNLQNLSKEQDASGIMRAGVMLKIKNLFSNLANLWLSHGDLKANNIVVVKDNPVLLDLDSMRLHYFTKSKQRALQRDKKRFLKNWQGVDGVM